MWSIKISDVCMFLILAHDLVKEVTWVLKSEGFKKYIFDEYACFIFTNSDHLNVSDAGCIYYLSNN